VELRIASPASNGTRYEPRFELGQVIFKCIAAFVFVNEKQIKYFSLTKKFWCNQGQTDVKYSFWEYFALTPKFALTAIPAASKRRPSLARAMTFSR
jgi:hypothetical protein